MEASNFIELRQIERENRKQMILMIAEKILHKEGLDAVTIRNVAKKGGLSTGALYMYFKDKEELFLSLLLENIKKLRMDLESCASIEEPIHILKSMAEIYKNFFLNYGRYINIFNYVTLISGKGKALNSNLRNELKLNVDMILDMLEKMLDSKQMKAILKDIPPKRAVPVLWSIIHGISQITLYSARAKNAEFDFEQVYEDTIKWITG